MASSSSSSADVQPKYQVFVSFRGEDTRNNFTSHLRKALEGRGIDVFYDDKKLEKGDQLAPALLGAIDGSKISAIVFSENYADSSWCLEEVSRIMDCRCSKEQLVVPIFYHVDPSHVRNQTGDFGKRFVELVKRKGTEITDKIQRWRDTLKEAGNLSGFHFKGEKPETEVIEEIVQDIIKKLNRLSRSVCNEGLVGIGPKLEQLKSLLMSIGKEDVGMIGIWGMGGIGKTTLARAIYNEVRHEFESCHLLEKVKEEFEKRGAITLRKEILSTLLEEENLPANSTYLQVTKDRLRSKRVLLVLDDVSDFEQLEELKIYKKNFGSGSRIIVTSRDKQVLENGSVDAIYEVKVLNHPDSVQLFCLHAFKQNNLVDDFRDLSTKCLKYAGGVPIALKVLGAALYKKEKNYWISKLNILEEHPPRGIFDVLKISFDGLETVERNLFLDIACFGYDADQLKSCYGGMADCALSNLVDKCLLSIVDNYFPHRMHDLKSCNGGMAHYNSNCHGMHDLLQEMGQTIVRQEFDNPGERSRLWKPDDVCRVLKNNLGTKSITRISLDMDNISKLKMLQICPCIFEKMVNLIFMRFKGHNNTLMLPNQELSYLPDTLKYLAWNCCPLKCLPSNFNPNNLVELRLHDSNIEQLWDVDEQDIDLVNLRVMVLSYCKRLCKIPNLLGAKRLETLWCNECKSLVQLPCMTHLVSLKLLHLSACPITKFPEVEGLIELEELWLNYTGIKEVPSFVGSLNKLRVLEMRGTIIRELNLKVTPTSQVKLVPPGSGSSSIPSLPCLRRLDVRDCKLLERVTFSDPGEQHSSLDIEEFRFDDCNKLNEAARDNIIAHVLIRIQSKAKQWAKQLAEKSIDVTDKSRPHKVLCCFPGSEISYKFENCSDPTGNPSRVIFSVTLDMESGLATNSTRFLCFAPCLVLLSERKYRSRSKVRSIGFGCNYQLEGTDGGSQNFRREWYLNADYDYSTDKYVYVLSGEDMVHKDKDYKKASFSFSSNSWPPISVIKCGIRVFSVDAESLTVTPVCCTLITFLSHEFDMPSEFEISDEDIPFPWNLRINDSRR